MNKVFETASFHIVKPCNMKCKFCYATFEDFHVGKQLDLSAVVEILCKLSEAGLKKITFAGGEPLLYKPLLEALSFSKSIGLTTSIITNGSLLTDNWLLRAKPHLDWVGLSIDSTDVFTNKLIGRMSKEAVNYGKLVHMVKHYDYKLKINTVVNRYNWQESLLSFIQWADPQRWKIFQALPVEGQNDEHIDWLKVTAEEFADFVARHPHPAAVVEDNAAMTSSYLLIDPLGRLFENTQGKHTYSDPLHEHSLDHCLAQINLSRDNFVKRGGIYEW